MADPRNDPVGVYHFYLTLVGTNDVADALIRVATGYKVAAFAECGGLDATVEVFEFREGGVNDFVHKFPTRASFANLTLRRGVVRGYTDLWDWHNGFVLGTGKRRDGVITLLDNARHPVRRWRFRHGLPVKWTGPVMNAGQSGTAVEALEISHEGLTREAV